MSNWTPSGPVENLNIVYYRLSFPYSLRQKMIFREDSKIHLICMSTVWLYKNKVEKFWLHVGGTRTGLRKTSDRKGMLASTTTAI